MKKFMVIGLVLTMVMGLAAMASASETDWCVYLRAGNLGGTSGTTWIGSASLNEYGVTTAALTGTKAPAGAGAWTASTVGFYTTDTTYTYGTRKYQSYVPDQDEYTWNLNLMAGTSWKPATAFNLYYATSTGIPEGNWNLTLSNGSTTYNLTTPATLGSSASNFYTFATGLTMAAGASEEWTLTMSSVPEPGSILALASGLVGLVGFGIRRRK